MDYDYKEAVSRLTVRAEMNRPMQRFILVGLALTLGVLAMWADTTPAVSQDDGPLARAQAHLRDHADRLLDRPGHELLHGDRRGVAIERLNGQGRVVEVRKQIDRESAGGQHTERPDRKGRHQHRDGTAYGQLRDAQLAPPASVSVGSTTRTRAPSLSAEAPTTTIGLPASST